MCKEVRNALWYVEAQTLKTVKCFIAHLQEPNDLNNIVYLEFYIKNPKKKFFFFAWHNFQFV